MVQDKFIKRFVAMMPPPTEDIVLIVLKGHLLVEGLLDDILDQVFDEAKFVDQARLNFTQKTRLAQGVFDNKSTSDIWVLIDLLNSLRNTLIHNLGTETITDKIRNLQSSFLKSLGEVNQNHQARESDGETVSFICAYLCGFLDKLKDDVSRQHEFNHKMRETMKHFPDAP